MEQIKRTVLRDGSIVYKFYCPECTTEIKDTQKDCPWCGYPAAKLQEAKAAAIKKIETQEAINAYEASNQRNESNLNYDVDSRAERILDNVAKAYLICGWIFGVIFFLAGIFAGVAIGLEEGGFLGIIAGILLGVLGVLLGYVAWALLKVIVNISNNLYNINFILNKK